MPEAMRILLEAKAQGLTKRIEPFVDSLSENGMWLSDEIREHVLKVAGEML